MNLAVKIMRISKKLRAIEDYYFSNHKLMKYEFNTLSIIAGEIKQNGKVCASDIANINGMSLSAVTRLLNNMESKNLIVRSFDRDDRRSVLITITEAGQKIHDDFMRNMNNYIEKIFCCLSDNEKEIYDKLSNTLMDMMETEFDKTLDKMREQYETKTKGV